MGYACPVCDVPQRDGEHLANHLAFTAMLHGGEHEDWLDERVEDWSDRTPEALGEAVKGYAAETEYEEVFEDTVGDHGHGGHTHAHEHGRGDHTREGAPGSRGADMSQLAADAVGRAGGRDELTEEAADVVSEAQELTREMLDGGSDGAEGGDDAADDEGAGDDAADAGDTANDDADAGDTDAAPDDDAEGTDRT